MGRPSEVGASRRRPIANPHACLLLAFPEGTDVGALEIDGPVRFAPLLRGQALRARQSARARRERAAGSLADRSGASAGRERQRHDRRSQHQACRPGTDHENVGLV